MKKILSAMLPVYIVVVALFIIAAFSGSKAITALSENAAVKGRTCVVIDAGHGGEDGGAVSCTGVSESQLNLQIALRLEDMLHLLGIDTYMIRTTDRSVHTTGNTIAARKSSDLKERVRVINELEPALVLSIHQNYFGDSRYSGPQTFYGNHDDSRELAATMQDALVSALTSGSNRREKAAKGVYLMEHIRCPALLIECGFLSNPEEEALLRDAEYQKKLCAVIAATVASQLSLDWQTNE